MNREEIKMGLFDKLLGKKPAAIGDNSTAQNIMDANIVDALERIDYFSKIGEAVSDIARFKVMSVRNIENAIKSMGNQKWENIQLEEDGDISVWLFKNNHKDAYNRRNDYVTAAKESILPKIETKIKQLPFSEDIVKTIEINISFNIVGIAVALCYRQYVRSEFYERMLQIYQSGHIPCGWQGKMKKGCFLVY
jgi:hypothetical protein